MLPKFGSHWTNKCQESPSNADKMKPFGSPHKIPYFPFAILSCFGFFWLRIGEMSICGYMFPSKNPHRTCCLKKPSIFQLHWIGLRDSGNSGNPWVFTARFCLKNGYPNKLMFHHRSYEKCTNMGKNLIFRPQRWTFSVGVVFGNWWVSQVFGRPWRFWIWFLSNPKLLFSYLSYLPINHDKSKIFNKNSHFVELSSSFITRNHHYSH